MCRGIASNLYCMRELTQLEGWTERYGCPQDLGAVKDFPEVLIPAHLSEPRCVKPFRREEVKVCRIARGQRIALEKAGGRPVIKSGSGS
jgi:hypothetical protein